MFNPPPSITPYLPQNNAVSLSLIFTNAHIDIYAVTGPNGAGPNLSVAHGTPLATCQVYASNNLAWSAFAAATVVPGGALGASADVEAAQAYYNQYIYFPYYAPLLP